ncbi:MAG TPA: class I SAM-dependent methyltransferase, partial [Microthrixaceae bacterium]|nr:class I SAM-dependent methyltransferase [Microthrixaceae bacterium]
GCGLGQTTVELSRRVGEAGYVLGVDVAPAMIDGAIRGLEVGSDAGANGSLPLKFRVGDMQSDVFDRTFDAAFSRFGVMFFPDPDVAFVNIAAAIRSGGRLAFVVWGPVEENPWATVPTIAAAEALGLGPDKVGTDNVGTGAPGPFSLGDPHALEALLVASGFSEVGLVDLTHPRRFGQHSALDELATWLTIGTLGDDYSAAGPDLKRQATEAALAAIEPYRVFDDEGGWALPALARVVTAAKH